MNEVVTILLLALLAGGLGWLWVNGMVYAAIYCLNHGVRFHVPYQGGMHW